MGGALAGFAGQCRTAGQTEASAGDVVDHQQLTVAADQAAGITLPFIFAVGLDIAGWGISKDATGSQENTTAAGGQQP